MSLLVTLLNRKPPSLEEQMAEMQKKIDELSQENKKLSTQFLSQIFPKNLRVNRKKINEFPGGYIRTLGEDGEYYIVDEYGNKTKEDYHYLQSSPNTTHIEAAQMMGEAGDKAMGMNPHTAVTTPEEIGDHWDSRIRQVRPKISSSYRPDIMGPDTPGPNE